MKAYLAVAKVIYLLADKAHIRLWFAVSSTAGNVVVGFGKTNDRALKANKHRLSKCGMVCLWVVVRYLIHPALKK